MAIEIERKFLLSGDGWRRRVTSSSFLRQGYLGGDGVSVRVRIDDDMANLNIKSRTPGIARSEFEYAGHVWEIDEFGGDNAGLVVAEIELDRVDESFERPDWIGLEVTDDIRYYNLNLSREPYSRWSEC